MLFQNSSDSKMKDFQSQKCHFVKEPKSFYGYPTVKSVSNTLINLLEFELRPPETKFRKIKA